jgi:hypothetical protein
MLVAVLQRYSPDKVASSVGCRAGWLVGWLGDLTSPHAGALSSLHSRTLKCSCMHSTILIGTVAKVQLSFCTCIHYMGLVTPLNQCDPHVCQLAMSGRRLVFRRCCIFLRYECTLVVLCVKLPANRPFSMQAALKCSLCWDVLWGLLGGGGGQGQVGKGKGLTRSTTMYVHLPQLEITYTVPLCWRSTAGWLSGQQGWCALQGRK